MPLKSKLVGLLRLFRLELPLSAGICVVLGEMLASARLPAFRPLFLGFAGVFLISAAALILNDFFDLESDRVNAPHRPLPSGQVTPREVVILFGMVSLAGFFVSYSLHPGAFWAALLVWAVGLLYNWRLKKAGLVGNLMVSFSVGMTFIFGGIAVEQPFAPLVWMFAGMALLINLGEEIAADASDLEGDKLAGSRSLAVRLGSAGALKISAALFTLASLVSSLPFLLGRVRWLFFTPILLMDAVILISAFQLQRAPLPVRRALIRRIYLTATTALLIFILMYLLVPQSG